MDTGQNTPTLLALHLALYEHQDLMFIDMTTSHWNSGKYIKVRELIPVHLLSPPLCLARNTSSWGACYFDQRQAWHNNIDYNIDFLPVGGLTTAAEARTVSRAVVMPHWPVLHAYRLQCCPGDLHLYYYQQLWAATLRVLAGGNGERIRKAHPVLGS